MKIVYCAQFRDHTGYAIAARRYLKALDQFLQKNEGKFSLHVYSVVALNAGKLSKEEENLLQKYEFKNDSEIQDVMKEEYIFIWHMPPPMMVFADERFKPSPNCSPSMKKLIKASSYNVSLVAWETDKVPSEWQENYDYYKPDAIIVPSKWNKDVFEQTSIRCEVVPHVIENISDNVKEIPNLSSALNKKFVIFSSSQWTHRKGFDVLLKAYFSEFGKSEDVVLVLKTYDSATHKTERISHEIKNYKATTLFEFNQKPKDNNLIVLPGFLSAESVAWLYNKSNVFALTSRGEGFGLPISEALLNKKPVIVPSEGGHIDFIEPDSAFFVDGRWDCCFLGIPPYETDGNYYECSIRDTRKQLRKAYNLWKENPKQLEEKGLRGHDYIKGKGYDAYNIGKRFFEVLDSVQIKEEENDIKSLRRNIKKQLDKKSNIEEKINTLKDSFKGKTCYILATGPSLLDYDKDLLKDVLKDNLVFSIKGAYELFPEETDFHFFNAANLPMPTGGFVKEHFKYEGVEPIVIASDNYPLHSRWSNFQKHDLFFQIPIRTQIDDRFLVKTLEFDKHTLDKTLERPCGPGIMYETVMYMAEHLGVSKIVTLGWDLNNDASKNESDHKHYYEDKKFFIKGDVLPWEIKATRDATGKLAEWLKSKNITLQTASKNSKISDKIERIKL